MKTYQLSIPLKIKNVSKIWMGLLCLTGFLTIGSVSSAKAQSCPSIYSVHSYASGTGIETTGSDIGVYYQIYRNGYVWDVYREGTGDFMQWENLCSGDYTIVTWKEGCAPLTLNFGVPVTINTFTCPSDLFDETLLKTSALIPDGSHIHSQMLAEIQKENVIPEVLLGD